GLDETIR
uniref:Globulin IV alpha subunit delta-1 chain(fragments) n=1 Tax=Cucurbita maxima TaxID=3661 RepID=P84495_CUCMA